MPFCGEKVMLTACAMAEEAFTDYSTLLKLENLRLD